MDTVLWCAVGILVFIILLLLLKIRSLQMAAGEIEIAFAYRIHTDTNTLIDLSTADPHMRRLADRLNAELRLLREERRRYREGDRELKTAVTGLSHDLRTPLTAICGYLDLLAREDTSPKVKSYLAVIEGRCETMRQLTEELFRYSVILDSEEPVEKERVVLNQALEEAVAAFYAVLLEKGITPHITIPDTKVIRTLDRSALSRILTNLLNNAVKYSDGDLDITLTEAGEMHFTNKAPGLDEVQVGRLFDRFYTVADGRSATGLGLAIARTLVQQMGGSMDATYQAEKLTIRVCLPG